MALVQKLSIRFLTRASRVLASGAISLVVIAVAASCFGDRSTGPHGAALTQIGARALRTPGVTAMGEVRTVVRVEPGVAVGAWTMRSATRTSDPQHPWTQNDPGVRFLPGPLDAVAFSKGGGNAHVNSRANVRIKSHQLWKGAHGHDTLTLSSTDLHDDGHAGEPPHHLVLFKNGRAARVLQVSWRRGTGGRWNVSEALLSELDSAGGIVRSFQIRNPEGSGTALRPSGRSVPDAVRVAFETLLPARLEAQAGDIFACALTMAGLTFDIFELNPIGILLGLAMYYEDCVHAGGNGGDWYAVHLPPVIIVAHCTTVTEWDVWIDDDGGQHWDSYTYNICD